MNTVPLTSLKFPIQYLEVCDGLIRARGGNLQEFHDQCGVTYEDLLNQSAMIDGEQFRLAYTITQQYCIADRPALFQILEFFPLTSHGMLGMLALASRTLEDAMNAAIEFFPLVMPAFKVSRHNIGNMVHLNFERIADFGDQNAFMTELVMGALHSIIPFMLAPMKNIYVQFAHTTVHPNQLYEDAFQMHIQHNADKNCIMIPRELLETPIMTQSPTLQRLLAADLRVKFKETHHKATSQQVRRLIRLYLDERRVIDTESIASNLKFSYRTLVRRLTQEETTFRQLLDEVSISYAIELIEHSSKPISEIAERLGFSNSANFARTFKRITGKTPSEYRQSPKS